MTRHTPNDWTIATYAAHNEALRVAEEKFQAERDRRNTEVQAEREKAIQIKEEADAAALNLARDIQKYKDEKANELREQINSERGLYATKGDLAAAVSKIEVTIKPLLETIAANAGRGQGISQSWGVMLGAVSFVVGLIIIGTFVFVFARPASAPSQTPQIIYVPAAPGTLIPSTPQQPPTN